MATPARDAMDHLDHAIEPQIAPEVARVLGEVGRTEDLRFSPDGRRLAIAGFAGRTVVLVDVVIGPAAVVVGGVLVGTTELEQPHGLDWLDEATLVVGDRAGGTWRVSVPPAAPGVHRAHLPGVRLEVDEDLVRGPGSIAVVPGRGDDERGGELLVCGNWTDSVTRHRLGPAPADATTEVWLRRSLDLPDGVGVSADGRWVAISNHNQQVVLVYDRSVEADPDDRRPVGLLRGSLYPHGLRFSPTGDLLLVADAGSPFVHVHRASADGWALAGYPDAAIRVVDDDAFARGHGRPDEGGPKGLDVDPTGRVLAVTTERRPLGFVDLDAVRRHPPPVDPAALATYEHSVLDRIAGARSEQEQARHAALAAEVREHDARALAARTDEHADAVAADAARTRAVAADALLRAEAAEVRTAEVEAHLAAIRATTLWRAAERPRRLYARLRGRRPRP